MHNNTSNPFLHKDYPFRKLIREFQTHSNSPHHARNKYTVNNVQACKWPCATTSECMYTEWMAPFKTMWLEFANENDNALFCFYCLLYSHFSINLIIKCDIFPCHTVMCYLLHS